MATNNKHSTPEFLELLHKMQEHSQSSIHSLPNYACGVVYSCPWRMWQAPGRSVRLVIEDEEARAADWPEYSSIELVDKWIQARSQVQGKVE